MRNLLGPGGTLPHCVPRYEERRGQGDMASAVARTLDEDRILLCEAATGTGKTLAYLVPALLSDRRVVIATASRALQEQIFHRDLPLARRVADRHVPATLVKGLSNYVCRRRLQLYRDAGTPVGREREALPRIEAWLETTAHGDVAELERLPEGHPIWPRITSSSETRLGGRCPHHDQCFVTRLKREAEMSPLLVVNHHLLLADLAIRGAHPARVLPDYDAIIIDEAHRLEDVATHFFGHRVTSQQVNRVLADAERGVPEDGTLVARCRNEATALFEALNLRLGNEERRPFPAAAWTPELEGRYFALDDALSALSARVASRRSSDGTTAMTAAMQRDVGPLSARLGGLRQTLADLVDPSDHHVAFLARDTPSGSVSLTARPVHVGPLLAERLFDQGPAIVLTSATLTAGGRFDFIRHRLGLVAPRALPVDELRLPSPYDHRRQVLLYVPTDLPPVDDPRHAGAAAARLVALLAVTPGGAFVLCTSHRGANALAGRLAHGLKGRRPLFVQGEAPKAVLLERFRDHRNAVLVATMSFWEGVDVPGTALRLVAIDRIPFAVPTDPLVVARAQAITEEGGSAFVEDALPRAALTLQQGYGRLVRHCDDVGVVAVLDRRLATKSYGRALIDSLPPARLTRDFEDVAGFWASLATES
ncbi:MAG: ATP-dependent DNA helicase [Myxococcota bacterium]